MSMTMIPTELLKNMPEEMQGFEPFAVICNILPEPVLPIIQTYGVYHIAYPKTGERYALTQVPWAAIYMDKGDSVFGINTGSRKAGTAERADNRIRSIESARRIALDLCQQMNSSDSIGALVDGTGPFWGKFVLKGIEPTEEELVAAEKRMRSYFLSIVKAADVEWGRSKRLDLIDGRARIASRILKVNDREWLSEYIPNMSCPACRESIRAGAKVCRFCGTMIDESGDIMAAPHEGRARKPRSKPKEPVVAAD